MGRISGGGGATSFCPLLLLLGYKSAIVQLVAKNQSFHSFQRMKFVTHMYNKNITQSDPQGQQDCGEGGLFNPPPGPLTQWGCLPAPASPHLHTLRAAGATA